MFNAPNQSFLFARYATDLTTCLRAALLLQIVDVFSNAGTLSAAALANALGIDPVAGRSFFNVLVAIGVLQKTPAGYVLPDQANALLSPEASLSLAPYLSIGLDGDNSTSEFVQYLKSPSMGARLYAEGGEVSLMDRTDALPEGVALGLASRAKRFARFLATLINNRIGDHASVLDLGAGSPYLAKELVLLKPRWRITLADRKNAHRFITRIADELRMVVQGQSQELNDGQVGLLDCNMFSRETLPRANSFDAIVLSNVLHDWAPEQIARIVQNATACMKENSLLVVHEGFLSFDPIDANSMWFAAYGMALNQLTAGQGSCYMVDEYDEILARQGLIRTEEPVATADGCQALFYRINNK